MEKNTQWRQVVGWPDYEVSSDGRVRRVSTGHVLQPINGFVRLAWSRSHRTYRSIRSLVAEAFGNKEPRVHQKHRDIQFSLAINFSDLPRLDGEEWRQSALPSFAVSNYGRLWSIRWARVMRTVVHNGYETVQSGQARYKVHRLVALAFCVNENPAVYDVVDHIDGNKRNNVASNLRWVSQAMNTDFYWQSKRGDAPRPRRGS